MKKLFYCLTVFILSVCALFAGGNKEVVNENKEFRVISLAPNVTEIICELDGIDMLVGRTDYCNYPEEVSTIQSIGDMYSPNIEMIISLQPDCVIASSIISPDVIERLNNAGIKSYQFFHEYEGIEGTYTLISEIGEVIGKTKESSKLIIKLKDIESKVLEKSKLIHNKKKCVLMITWGEWGDYAATKDTFLYDLIEKAGGINITQDATYWAISKELLLSENPDVVFITDTSNAITENMADAFKNTQPYNMLKASINDNVYVLDTDSTTRLSVRLFNILEEVSNILSNNE